MIKPLLTGHEIRHNAKTRLQRHREAMLEKGYKTVSVFMGAGLRSELDHLAKTKDLTKYQALEHIFNIYCKSVYGGDSDEPGLDPASLTVKDIISVTSNKEDKGKDSNQFNIFDPEPVPDTATAATPDKKARTKPAPLDTASTKPFHLGDYHGQDIDLDTKDRILIQLAVDLPGPKNAQARVDVLNAAGITCGRKRTPWTKKNLADNLYLAKKRQSK